MTVTFEHAMGDRLRMAREAAGLSQRQAARLLETHQTTIGRWETAEQGLLVADMLRFARLYDVDPSWIIGIYGATDLANTVIGCALQKLPADDREKILQLLAMKGRRTYT